MKKSNMVLCLLTLLSLNGCLAIGPTTNYKTTFVNQYDSNGNPVKIGRVEENVKVKIRYETDSKDEYVQMLDIGGWSVSPPPLPTPLEAAKPKTVPSFAIDSIPQLAYHIKVGIGHGTGFMYQGFLVTCAHVMDGKDAALVWNGSEWIDAVLLKIDPVTDVAILAPSSAFGQPDAPAGFVCYARNGKLDVYATLRITKELDGFCTMKGFDHGASGSPVFKDGKLYGMARAIKQRSNWRKVMVRTDEIEVVPVSSIDTLLP